MEQGFIDILQKLVSEQGSGALTDAKKCKAYINDYTGSEYKKERRFITQAVEAGAAKAIAGAQDLAACKKAQARELEEEFGLSPAVAADIVDTLALVLRGDASKTQAKTPPKPQAAPAGTKVATVKPTPEGEAAFRDGKEYDNFVLPEYDFNKALKLFTEAINLGCANIHEAYQRRARLYSWEDQYDSAINDYTTAISLDPNNKWNYSYRGDLYYRLGQYDKAISDYTTVISLYPNEGYAYQKRGNAYYNKGMKNEVIGDLEKILSLNQDYSFDPMVYNWAKDFLKELRAGTKGAKAFADGKMYLAMVQSDNAVKSLTEAINLGCTDMAVAYFLRGQAYGMKQLDLTINDLTTAISLNPNYTEAYALRGAMYNHKGQYDQAMSDFMTAISLDPNYALTYAARGMTYHKKGMKNEATREAEKALSLDPNNQQIKEVLQFVRGF